MSEIQPIHGMKYVLEDIRNQFTVEREIKVDLTSQSTFVLCSSSEFTKKDEGKYLLINSGFLIRKILHYQSKQVVIVHGDLPYSGSEIEAEICIKKI